MKFNSVVFERLLFSLHKQAYRHIQDALDEVDRKHPQQLQRILADFKEAAQTDTHTATRRAGNEKLTYPTLDVLISFDKSDDHKLSTLYKSKNYEIAVNYDEKKPSYYTGSHLQLGFFRGNVLNAFIVPLEYFLGFNEQAVLREGSYQLYSHTILSQETQKSISNRMEAIGDSGAYKNLPLLQQEYQKKSLLYVGITKRTWQERYRQHCRDSERGSNLRFHRALRGEFCSIGCIEHIVERAGLTERQALEIEEKEVEKRSLHSLYPNGLNMIPGGYAGLKCIHEYAKRTGYTMKGELKADNVEAVLVEVQKHTLNRHFNSADIQKINAEIARLWAEDIHFRINAMTGQQKRFSFRQIQAARIWHFSGWSKEKILEYLRKLDSKEIGIDQLERLLKGETYASIPDVLI